MGKPYATELEQLHATYAWAATAHIDDLVAAVSATATLPLLAVGSGGSLSAAHHASDLHQECSSLVSKAVTPLELVRSSIYLGAHGVMLLSAGGTNADIIGSLRNVIEREPRRCSVLCFRRGSALSELAAENQFVNLVEMTPPTARDGFLSTNSLLAFAVVLERAYARVFGTGETFSESLEGLFPSTPPLDGLIAKFRRECRPLWGRDTVLVLHGPGLHAAAVDLESKFSEAALGHVQVADLRNFAHGRHNWLAKRADTTGVLALFSDTDRELTEATLKLLPRDVPVARIGVPASGARSRVAALVAVLHAVGNAGEAREIDPGRPHVPPFGRKIYHLQAFSKSRSARLSPEVIAVSRKMAVDPHNLGGKPEIDGWSRAYREFLAGLGNATFGSVLFDYDGTLCDGRDRFTGIREEIASSLKRILSAQVPVGIATGRGKSVREDLRKVLPQGLWDRVFLGYYNCTEIARLTDESFPSASGASVGSLSAAAGALSRHPIIVSLATMEVRPTQVSLQANSAASAEIVWRAALDLVQLHGDLKVLRSSHSIDILKQSASKKALLQALSEVVAPKPVLCAGDMGRWPGNDHEILASQYSLSVDEVSTATGSCWNLAPAGIRGVQATVHYLGAINAARGAFTLDINKLTSRGTTRERS
jgi:fructoselysine-6-P-deglycase FrlB-like protein